MNSFFKIQDVVLRVSDEAKLLVPEMPVIKNESKLLSELVLCILSSQEKYEVALAVAKQLKKYNILVIPKNDFELLQIKSQIKNILSKPVSFIFNGKSYSRRLRFFSKKSSYIITTLKNIYLNNLTIKKIINYETCVLAVRKNIINYCQGLGPKQASMFLRNIGFHSEFAVLDKHVIDYMKLIGLVSGSLSNFSSISSYQKIETKLKIYAESININILHLDLAIWATMRTAKKYQA